MTDMTKNAKPVLYKAGDGAHVYWFDILDDPTVLLIINYLDFQDRIRLELLSKRWKLLLQQSWKSVSKLNLEDLDKCEDLPPGPHTLSRVEVTVNGLIPPFLISRCGPGLMKILVSNSSFGQLGWELQLDNCPLLTSVTLKKIVMRPKHLRALVPLGPQLRELAFILCDVVYSDDSSQDNAEHDQVFRVEVQEAFSALFSSGQLKRFECSAVDYDEDIFWVGECLRRLPHTLRYLDFPWCGGWSNAEMSEFLGNQPALVDLRLTVIGDPALEPELGGMTAILEKMPQLETFCLKEEEITVFANTDLLKLHGIGKMANLRELDVTGCSGFGNDVLKEVCLGCSDLKILRMRNTVVEHRGLTVISSVKNLEILDIFGLDISGEIGKLVSGLKEIYLDGLYCTRNELQCIARNCPRLESLHIQRGYEVKPQHLKKFIHALMAGNRAGLPCKILIYDDGDSGVSKSRTFTPERSVVLPIRDFKRLCEFPDIEDLLGSDSDFEFPIDYEPDQWLVDYLSGGYY